MKTPITSEQVQASLFLLTTFFASRNDENRPTLFHIRLTTPDEYETVWAEEAIWQLRTKAPDGTSREAIFPSVEGIIVRCTPPPSHTFTSVLMCNLLLPWQAVIEQSKEELTISLGEKTRLTFVREPLHISEEKAW